MKTKKMLSILLAAVMVFGLLCTPALAASPTEVEEALDQGYPWMDLTNWEVREDVTVKLRQCRVGEDETTLVKDTETVEAYLGGVICVPKGVTITVGPAFGGKLVWAYSDPDGDGIFEQRLERDTWYEVDGEKDYEMEIVPLSEPGPFVSTDTVDYGHFFVWGAGNNQLEWMAGLNGYCTLTADYLLELFGENTIIEFSNGENSVFYLLTGEERGEALGDDPIENYGVSVSEFGYLTSAWAKDTVDLAVLVELLPSTVEEAHGYNLRGEITRGEFAALAMYLYMDFTGTDGFTYTTVSPFVDVDENDPNFECIMGAYDLGIVQGTSTAAKTFEPDALVSRQDAALMLSRVYTVLGGTVPAGASTTFSDNARIAPYAMDAVAFMSSKGIINGRTNGAFDPKGNASVEEALKIALEMLKTLDV